jgi:hypothetical protein
VWASSPIGSELGLAGQELTGDRVGGIAVVDQPRQRRCQRHRIARGDRRKRRQAIGRDEAGVGQRLGGAEGCG